MARPDHAGLRLPADSPRMTVLFWLLLLATLLVATTMSGIGVTSAVPNIVCLELCGLTGDCAQYVGRLFNSEAGRLTLRSIRLDYVFIPLYSGFLILALLRQATYLPARLARIGRLLCIAIPFAAVCDVAENLLLVAMIQDNAARLGTIMSLLAGLKFLLLLAVAGWLLVMGIRFWFVAPDRS
jgi:hypothetical protein